jgi:hypothetical protein
VGLASGHALALDAQTHTGRTLRRQEATIPPMAKVNAIL